MIRPSRFWFAVLLAGCWSTAALAQEQTADPDFDAKVAVPTYKDQHPAVLFDEAHHNFHTTGGRYKPFVTLITSDGYRVEANTKPFSRPVLGRYKILIIANATGGEGPAQAGDPAMTDGECQAVEGWVKAGGSLFLITDMLHWGAASQRLGRRFGVEMSQGVTVDPQNSIGAPAQLLFSRENELLGDHPILQGRGPDEQVNRVVTYAGQSLKGPRNSIPLLKLADSAWDRYEQDPVLVSAAGRCQGLALGHGKGRVVILGEAGCLSAQFGPNGRPFGMNDPGNENRKFALNIMHWLSGLLPAGSHAATKPGQFRRPSTPLPQEGP